MLIFPRRSFGQLALVLFSLWLTACTSSSTASMGSPAATLTSQPTASPLATMTTSPALSPSPSPTMVSIHTPMYTPARTLLAQVEAVGPVYVTGDQAVQDAALVAAGTLLQQMLHNRPDIAVTLRAHGVFTAVAAHDERICDLPYFAGLDQQHCAAYGMGGAGGVVGLPITACDERNLLKEPDDVYQRGAGPLGQNICVHELAHTIMNVALAAGDLARITARFQAAQTSGLWTGDYAMTNAMEFWAVMSQFYFAAGPNAPYSGFHHIANGAAALQRYDPQTFALLDSIYQGALELP